MTRPEGLTTSLYSLGAKLFVSVCRSTLIAKYLAPLAVDTFLLKLGVSGKSILGIAKGKLPLHCISNLPLGVTNEGREAIKQSFLAPLSGTPLFKIGELHAIFYLCFLVLLLYLSVFALVFFIKNNKKKIYLLVVLSV